MIWFLKKRTMWFLLTVLVLLVGILAIKTFRFTPVSAEDFNYRVFVAGLGTVDGKWAGSTGIALIGLETRPASEQDRELKVVDLLITNNSSTSLVFDSDISLVDSHGNRFGLKAQDQPEVVIKPGAMSQGTVIIDVPKGVPDNEWLLEIKGGSLLEGMILPLRINKVVSCE